MSRTTLTISYLAIVTLGILGVWQGSVAVDSSEARRWLGLLMLVGAVAGMVVIYRRHVRPAEREKEVEWQHIKARGKLRFVLRQVLVSQVVWFPILFGGAYELYKSRSLTGLSAPPRWWYLMALASAIFNFVWSLAWWHRQEKLRRQQTAA